MKRKFWMIIAKTGECYAFVSKTVAESYMESGDELIEVEEVQKVAIIGEVGMDGK